MKKMGRKRHGELENILKGAANHRRIQIMELLERIPHLSGLDIAEELDVDFRTVSLHTRRLAQAGLVNKHHKNRAVLHELTSRGKDVLTFARTLE